MPERVHCPLCDTLCLVAEQYFGKPVKCSHCQQVFVVPGANETPYAMAVPASTPGRTPVLDIGARTSVGRVRERNEDSFLVLNQSWSHLDKRQELALLVVADGMGGYEAGDVASKLAVRTIRAFLASHILEASNPKPESPRPHWKGLLTLAVEEANRVVHREAKEVPSHKGMGATLASALICDGEVWIGHVGDCRVYHLRGDRFTQVTKDQTLVTRMVELGTLSAKEARHHPAASQVTHALGRQSELEPAEYQLRLEVGDWLLLACDGLQAHVEDEVLPERIRQCGSSAFALANDLVELANRGGGTDNCTVLAVHCV